MLLKSEGCFIIKYFNYMIQTKNLAFIISFVMTYFFNAQILETDFACTYNLEYKSNGRKDNEQFIMFIDVKGDKSYFLASNNYVKDTARITTVNEMMNYESDFNEKIYTNGNSFGTYESVKDMKISTFEENNLNWKILKDTKKQENFTLQLAKTQAYGRTWYAWFSTEIPINFGPYKFRGLPGFIVSLFDEKNDFIFTLQNFKHKKKTIQLPYSKKYKKLAKIDYNKVRFKIKTADDGIVLFDNSIERDKWFNSIKKTYLRLAYLDIQYPMQ